MRVNHPIGISLIWHIGKLFHMGKYVKGIFSDNNELLDPDKKEGWGIKFDLYIAWIRRPVPKMLTVEFWRDKPKLREFSHSALKKKNQRVYEKLMLKLPVDECPDPKDCDLTEINDFKYGVNNPWKGFYWFRLRVWPIIPLFFFALSTPWRSFYFGFKTSKIHPKLPEPLTKELDCGDVTWIDAKDLEICGNEPYYRSAVPSMTTRADRN